LSKYPKKKSGAGHPEDGRQPIFRKRMHKRLKLVMVWPIPSIYDPCCSALDKFLYLYFVLVCDHVNTFSDYMGSAETKGPGNTYVTQLQISPTFSPFICDSKSTLPNKWDKENYSDDSKRIIKAG
jgi:hypothetical protein